MPKPGVLSNGQREELRRLLTAERRRAVTQIGELDRTFDELVAAADLEPPDDEHDPDGTTAYERAQVSSLRTVAARSVDALDAAISALDAGIYGTCASCGAPVPYERLVAVLGTDRCVACASGLG